MTAEIAAPRHYVPKRSRRRRVGFISALLVMAGGAPTLLGAIGVPWLSAAQRWLYLSTSFDVLNNFLPIWAALLALGLIIALVQRNTSRIYIAIAAALLLISLIPIGLELYRAPARVAYGPGYNPARSLRIIQFNALKSNDNLDAALKLVLNADADIITVEESERFRTLEKYIQIRYPYKTPCPHNSCDAIIYSRIAPLATDYATPQGTWYRKKGYDYANGELELASMTLPGPDGVPFTAFATHFRWPWPPMPVLHQRDVFLAELGEIDRSRAIVGGDFNLTPWTHEMRGLDADLEPMQRVTRALFSFPVPFRGTAIPIPMPILPIDHVYAGSRWRLVKAERGPQSGSDHYPVIIELVMPVEPKGS